MLHGAIWIDAHMEGGSAEGGDHRVAVGIVRALWLRRVRIEVEEDRVVFPRLAPELKAKSLKAATSVVAM